MPYGNLHWLPRNVGSTFVPLAYASTAIYTAYLAQILGLWLTPLLAGEPTELEAQFDSYANSSAAIVDSLLLMFEGRIKDAL